MGVVREVENRTTKKVYKIEDHTGLMDVTHWVDDDGPDAADDEAREGLYVKAVGQMKTFNGIRSINAFQVKPVKSSDVITQHLLECMLTHMQNTKGPTVNPAAAGGGAMAPMGGVQQAGRPMVGGDQQYGGSFQAAPVAQEQTGNTDQQMVLTCIQQATDESGISVQDITGQLGGRVKETAIREAIEWLSNEGHVYSTIDDDHFKSTLL